MKTISRDCRLLLRQPGGRSPARAAEVRIERHVRGPLGALPLELVVLALALLSMAVELLEGVRMIGGRS